MIAASALSALLDYGEPLGELDPLGLATFYAGRVYQEHGRLAELERAA